ncbi:hypothetical protein [Nostoc commune]|uniref:hypothetical protein n=1 Tax=Nostoc commune TaxID=1178 RepID=UPI002073AA30|nr:hypothetical protein [Nostoc commune]
MLFLSSSLTLIGENLIVAYSYSTVVQILRFTNQFTAILAAFATSVFACRQRAIAMKKRGSFHDFLNLQKVSDRLR